MTMERKLAAVVQQTEGGTQLLPPRDGQQQHPIEVGGRCNDVTTFSFYYTFLAFFFYRFVCVFLFLIYIFYFIVIVLCFSAFDRGHLGQWRYGNAFSIIIISTVDCLRNCYDDR